MLRHANLQIDWREGNIDPISIFAIYIFDRFAANSGLMHHVV